MCQFDKNRWIAQNRDKVLKAAREGKDIDALFKGVVLNRLFCVAVSVGSVIVVLYTILNA